MIERNKPPFPLTNFPHPVLFTLMCLKTAVVGFPSESQAVCGSKKRTYIPAALILVTLLLLLPPELQIPLQILLLMSQDRKTENLKFFPSIF